MNDKLVKTIGNDGKTKSPHLKPGLKNFIIDIDGVICEDVPNEEPERMKTAKELKGSKKMINEWFKQGHVITFFTSRDKSLKNITVNWLKEHGFNYHNIIFNKPRGGNYHYIDDKPIKATNFKGKLTPFVYKKKEVEVFK